MKQLHKHNFGLHSTRDIQSKKTHSLRWVERKRVLISILGGFLSLIFFFLSLFVLELSELDYSSSLANFKKATLSLFEARVDSGILANSKENGFKVNSQEKSSSLPENRKEDVVLPSSPVPNQDSESSFRPFLVNYKSLSIYLKDEERKIAERKNELMAFEKQHAEIIEKLVASTNALRKAREEVVVQRKDELEKLNAKYQSLADIYSKMSAAQAAGILSEMDSLKVARILNFMKPKNLAEIMALFKPEVARAVSESLLKVTSSN